uniref:T9SS type A sorting domain-containing protein n=1 Tax=candidate division WOR-3 bacterium TaxID=2052148 RepID=A0A7C6A9Y8_UNCW3
MYLSNIIQTRHHAINRSTTRAIWPLMLSIAFSSIITASVFAVTIFSENFNSNWSTTNPPPGWTITFTGDTSSNDWHRRDLFEQPWSANPTPYACIFGSQITGDSPDSLISDVIDCTNYYDIVLRCSTYFQPLIGPYRAVLLGSTDGGLTWPYIIRDYTNQIVPAQLELFNLPWAWNQPLVRFCWVGEGDQAGLGFWCIDNITLTGLAVNDTDIATIRIRRPKRFEIPGTVTPIVKFMNVGRDTQYNVAVTCSIIHLPDSVVVHSVTDTIDTFPANDSIVHYFSFAWTADTGRYKVFAFCDAVGEQERSNDTLDRRVKVGWHEEQEYDDSTMVGDSSFVFERYGFGLKFEPSFYPALVESVKFYFTVSDTLSNRFRVRICDDDGPLGSPGTPLFESRILTAVTGWNSYDLLPDSIVVWDSTFYLFFIQVEGSPLSPKLGYDRQRDTSASYWVCYDTSYVQDFTPGDWMIRCVLNYQFTMPRPNPDDFRTVFISNPEENVVVRPPNLTFIPKARVENWGDLPQAGVSVVCSIISITNPAITPYVSTRIVDLNPGADTFLSFDPWRPAFRGLGRVLVRTLLPTDMDTTNDAKEETTFVHRSYFTGLDFSTYDYRWIDSDTTGGPVYSWIDTSGHLPDPWTIHQGDDATWFIPLTDTSIGFPLKFYDRTDSNLWVSTNGWIQIGPWTGSFPGYPVNTPLPDTLPPSNAIYAFWDDLVCGPLDGGGGIYFKKVGTAPNRKFVVIYQDVRRKYAPVSDLLTFEVIFAENGVITVQYKDVFCSDARYNYGASATVGIENANDSLGLMYLYGEGEGAGLYPGNKLKPGLAIQFYPYKKDIALFRKVAPPRYTLPGIVTPQFRLVNYGNIAITDPFWTKLRIRSLATIYDDSVETNVTLQPGDSITLNFTPINLDLGKYSLACSVAFLIGEKETLNNILTDSIFVQAWAQKPDIPLGHNRKKVKDGALAYYPAQKKVFALKGGNDVEFFQYDIMTEKWDTLASLPDSNVQTGRRRKAKAGTALCYGNNYLFAIKGGKTQDFYSYDIINNTWTERCTIPQVILGPSGPCVLSKPNYGAALVYADINNQVYLLSGNKTRQFLAYNPQTNTWRLAKSIPPYYTRIPGSDLRERKVKAGGALTIGGDTIYALKGGRSNEFYGYIVSGDTWVDLRPVPLGTGNRKVKSGASLAYHRGRVYCFKGGNTQEFWVYQPMGDTFGWIQASPIPLSPRNKKVKRGGALIATDSLLFAFKGGSTQEFWAYGPGAETLVVSPSAGGTMAEASQKKITFGVWLFPNPGAGHLQIRYGVTRETKIRLEIYNILGERKRRLVDEVKPIGEYIVNWDGKADDGKELSAGVYIVRVKQDKETKTTKMILAK